MDPIGNVSVRLFVGLTIQMLALGASGLDLMGTTSTSSHHEHYSSHVDDDGSSHADDDHQGEHHNLFALGWDLDTTKV